MNPYTELELSTPVKVAIDGINMIATDISARIFHPRSVGNVSRFDPKKYYEVDNRDEEVEITFTFKGRDAMAAHTSLVQIQK